MIHVACSLPLTCIGCLRASSAAHFSALSTHSAPKVNHRVLGRHLPRQKSIFIQNEKSGTSFVPKNFSKVSFLLLSSRCSVHNRLEAMLPYYIKPVKYDCSV